MRSKNKAKHLFSLSCGSTKSTTMRKRKGRGEWQRDGGGEGVEGDVAGPVLLMPCPAVSDSGFAFGAKICSKFAAGIRRGQCRQQRTRAGERGRLSSSSRTNWRKIYRCLKKRRDEIKQKTRCQRQQRRYGDVDVSVGGSPCLTQLCTKFMIFYLSVGEGEQPARARARGGLGGSALRLHFP